MCICIINIYIYILNRKKVVNINSTPNFNPMKLNLIISKVWKLKKKSTRSNGVKDKILLISYSQQMVKK